MSDFLGEDDLKIIYDEIDQKVARNSALLGDRFAGMTGEIIYKALQQSAARKNLSSSQVKKIDDSAIRVWTLEAAQNITASNERFNKWVIPIAGLIFILVFVSTLIPSGGSQKNNYEESRKNATEFIN